MFVLDNNKNELIEIKKITFSESGFKEREHLQEWIANKPDCLGEELLIIQKEFDGFNDTKERLDLLALDKMGNIVVIENKLDDSGKDVTWQILKYVSYCSTLTKIQIKEIYQEYLEKNNIERNAEELLIEFYNNTPFSEITINKEEQRMILIAANFRKEVTSTVLWMLNYGIKVQCFKITPYNFQENIILDLEQIIPVKEAEEYTIKMAEKTRENKELSESNKGRHKVRMKYWTELLERFNNISNQYRNVSPSKDHWLSNGAGVSGIYYSFIITKSYAGIELLINKGSKEYNEQIFRAIMENKEKIEELYKKELSWEILEQKKSCRIADRIDGVNIFNEEDWGKIKEFHCSSMKKFEETIKNILITAVNQVKQK